eukprot:CAMPEP_0202688502 /NCGR_PEP_ID=MMETSP1385-20130828/4011_1 /ASSEMBLY_ACC=CAM_ASM_000861 /TAXON_ID=933848 /ORGANISM="Elphidium margaritaceum" /LENGTH=90 /DNA_ID=CAMNT_0049343495 /DNA_START=11 /DNA_END=280 /DNA_ORIENTATION=+
MAMQPNTDDRDDTDDAKTDLKSFHHSCKVLDLNATSEPESFRHSCKVVESDAPPKPTSFIQACASKNASLDAKNRGRIYDRSTELIGNTW